MSRCRILPGRRGSGIWANFLTGEANAGARPSTALRPRLRELPVPLLGSDRGISRWSAWGWLRSQPMGVAPLFVPSFPRLLDRLARGPGFGQSGAPGTDQGIHPDRLARQRYLMVDGLAPHALSGPDTVPIRRGIAGPSPRGLHKGFEEDGSEAILGLPI